MPLYENSVIYKLVHKEDQDNENIYIGSTTNFRNRKLQHKRNCLNDNYNKNNFPVYKYIHDNGGWDCWEMVAIENFKCENKRELEIRERFHIEKLKSKLNKIIPTRTSAEWRKDNEEKIKEKKKDDYINNIEYKLLKQKIYYDNHKEERKEYDKQYYLCNKDKINERKREYDKQYRKNPKRIKWAKTKIKCDVCGCEVSRLNISTHKKSKKCKNISHHLLDDKVRPVS
tara:strand:+ start:7 stop:690 length:684 start_codon:yes stop_codon:yes gene_type:complete